MLPCLESRLSAVFWGRLIVSRHEEGGDGQVIGMVEDIDEQKRRERQLEERDRQLQQIRENVTEVVFPEPQRTIF